MNYQTAIKFALKEGLIWQAINIIYIFYRKVILFIVNLLLDGWFFVVWKKLFI